ncbi:Alpha/Beta hydrolase protein [Pseudoneurospora amorphoporcata]|uniref:Alpha/Beta hydrolase protein n=1 Tax=Pseudoneurospora amorphoporcata TaxID=241081 RepID=A0AAN6SJY7_9PEZI|nr:Alpha/Beta hydrolase protein [Pseudoneurospora amorphoporcata]
MSSSSASAKPDLPTGISPCCLTGFRWSGTPQGTVLPSELPGTTNAVYKTGTNPKVAILLIHNLFGWTFPNVRLLADHYAAEANATVFVPDFFDGFVVPPELLIEERWAEIDLKKFAKENARGVREPEIFAFAKALKTAEGGGFEKVGAVGYCYGGWAVFRLAAAEHESENGKKLVDAVAAGHPTYLTKEDIKGVSRNVPVQVLAPEFDPQYTAVLKLQTFVTLQKLGVPFEYLHFPGVHHACFIRGDEKKEGEREAMVRGKNATVAFFKQWLHRN